VDRGRDLDHPEATGQHGDQQLGRLVLRLLQPDRPGHLGPHRPQAERRVGDVRAGQQADRGGEHPGAEAAHRVLGLLAAQLARPGDEVGVACYHRGQHPLHLGRVVLAVRVGGHDVLGATLTGQPVAEAQRSPLAAIDLDVGDQGAVLAALGHGLVPGAVRHHHRGGGQAAEGRWQRIHHRAEHALLVVGGDDDGHRR
jgi:hypothetical protein